VTSISVWQLQTGSDRRPWLYSDLDVFAQFRGRPLRRRWVAPEVEITAKSKAAGDGLCWSGGPPVVSEHARDVLSSLLRGHAEFLPLLTLRRRAFFVLNVTRRIDCLNEQRSDVVYYPDAPSRIMNAHSFRFHTDRLEPVPAFVCSSYPRPTFVTKPFVELVVRERLRGFQFADPKADPFRAILAGVSANVVAGALP
jgi:hypothetical protein